MRLPDLNDLMQDLQLAKQIAIDERNPNAVVIATMSQAKLLSLDRPVIKDVVADDVTTLNDLISEIVSDKQKRAAFNERLEYVRNEY
ncbi:hypothetical protein CXF56_09900 [Psychrobacter sp. Choline-02u-13]|uniref:hypothetical protein n=1 Tax=unclassified Psychrobacter TaxID=196806 RepID=UPI000C7B5D55|nr:MULTISPECIES: hypothetical protein [unclassified Psychrobacter]PKG64532.1 hypothetical protein CXF56_09900 [Psychrobacter sp. Choline-02u-13]PKH48712.1 hypothetical protein CXF69_10420 [Psychrobacter sp. Choline-02u-9]